MDRRRGGVEPRVERRPSPVARRVVRALGAALLAGAVGLTGPAAAGSVRAAASGDGSRKGPASAPAASGDALRKAAPASPAVPPATGFPLGVALGGLMERVEEAMRQAPAAVRPATVDAGSQLMVAVDKARLSWETRLGQSVRDLDGTTRRHLTELEASVARLEKTRVDDLQEAERAAARLFETILLVRGQPQVASAHPRLVVRGLPEENTTLTVSGTFPAVREVGDRPFLFVGGITLMPESISTARLTFGVPHRLLSPTLAGRIGLTRLVLVVPYRAGWPSRRREADFPLLLGTLPERPGTAVLRLAEPRRLTQTEPVRSPTMSQGGEGVDRRGVPHCGPPVPEGWAVRPESVRVVVEWFLGTPGSAWSHGDPGPLAPAVCAAWTTLHRRLGVSGRVVFHYAYEMERVVDTSEWREERLELAWGQTVTRPLRTGAWKVTVAPWDAVAQAIEPPGGSLPPYVTVGVSAGALVLQVSPAPEVR